MPYCYSALKIETPATAIKILSAFAQEQCCAQQFNIDGGLNDLRAVQQNNPHILGFFCRHTKDIVRTESKIRAFTKAHPFECESVKIDEFRKNQRREG
jgi:hypothetical protein